MAGSTTVTGNKGRTRKTSSRSRVRYGWRKQLRFALLEAKRQQEILSALTKGAEL